MGTYTIPYINYYKLGLDVFPLTRVTRNSSDVKKEGMYEF